jgi:protein-tyrosine phosphatase
MSDQRFGILTVCTANICRSPMMEIMLRERLDPDRFEVASAGVEGFVDRPMDAMSEMELMRFGLSADTFRSHRLDEYLIGAADLIVTATVDHRHRLLEMEPRAMRSSFTLRELAALTEVVDDGVGLGELVAQAAARRHQLSTPLDIADPFRRSPRVHRVTADQIREAVDVIAARLNACPV